MDPFPARKHLLKHQGFFLPLSFAIFEQHLHHNMFGSEMTDIQKSPVECLSIPGIVIVQISADITLSFEARNNFMNPEPLPEQTATFSTINSESPAILSREDLKRFLQTGQNLSRPWEFQGLPLAQSL
jgi:hypothetical protein